MKSLVVSQNIKQITDNGTEQEIATSQTKREYEYFDKKEVSIKAVKVTIDEDKFKTAIGGTLSSSYYYFEYSGSQWDMYDGAENVDLADYGITLEGTVLEYDRIYVYCDTAKNVVTGTDYEQELTIYIGVDKEIFNYVNISCDVPTIRFAIYSKPSGSYISILGTIKQKAEIFFSNDYKTAKISAYVSGYFDVATIKIIVAKVI